MPSVWLGVVCVHGSVRVGFVCFVPRGGGLCGGVLIVPYVCLGVWCSLVRFAWFVTSVFVSYVSNSEGACVYAGSLRVAAYTCWHGGFSRVCCVFGVIYLCGCLDRKW